MLRPDGDAEHDLARAALLELGVREDDVVRVFRTFNANAEAFREESEARDAR